MSKIYYMKNIQLTKNKKYVTYVNKEARGCEFESERGYLEGVWQEERDREKWSNYILTSIFQKCYVSHVTKQALLARETHTDTYAIIVISCRCLGGEKLETTECSSIEVWLCTLNTAYLEVPCSP